MGKRIGSRLIDPKRFPVVMLPQVYGEPFYRGMGCAGKSGSFPYVFRQVFPQLPIQIVHSEKGVIDCAGKTAGVVP